MKLPKAKSNDIVVMNLENETLVYDLKTNKAFCLNETAATVYQYCDGTKTFAELSAKHNFSDELIFFTLDELKKEQLVETEENYQSPFVQMTRREIVKKIGLASMIALPLVASVVAPTAINAVSGCIGGPDASGVTYEAGGVMAVCGGGGTCITGGSCCTDEGCTYLFMGFCSSCISLYNNDCVNVESPDIGLHEVCTCTCA